VWNLWRSLRPKSGKPPRSLLRQYCSTSAHSLALLGVLWAGSSQAGYTLNQLGFDMPLSSAGAWGLGCSVLLLGGLWAVGSVIERRKTSQAREEDERKMLASSSIWYADPDGRVGSTLSRLFITAAHACHWPATGDCRVCACLWYRAWLRKSKAVYWLHCLGVLLHDRVCLDTEPVVVDSHPRVHTPEYDSGSNACAAPSAGSTTPHHVCHPQLMVLTVRDFFITATYHAGMKASCGPEDAPMFKDSNCRVFLEERRHAQHAVETM
jgi:hypothetical protein